ncbi:MAG: hypothetical protein WCX65_06495 [bacterium]
MDKKLNCWEVMKCGREPGGKNVGAEGECPTASTTQMDEVHEGVNGGRACWVIAGTMCKGKGCGSYASKISDCKECDFYKRVWDEEGNGKTLLHPIDLLKIYLMSNKK